MNRFGTVDVLNYLVTDGFNFSQGFIEFEATPINDAPIAIPDSVTVSRGSSGNLIFPLANDNPGPFETNGVIAIQSFSQPLFGTVSLLAGSQFSYTPAADFTGTDTFSYTIFDEGNLISTATVTIAVQDIGNALASISLGARRNGQSIVDSTGQFNVGLGEDFDLEVLWTDHRSGGNRLGVFSIYADILVSQSDLFLPVVGETFDLIVTEDVIGGSLSITGNGQTAALPASSLGSATSVKTFFEQTLGYGTGAVRVKTTAFDRDPFNSSSRAQTRARVTFVGDAYVLRDLPDITVNTSSLLLSSQPIQPVFSLTVTPALAGENGDGVVVPNEINPAAILASVDFSSRSFTDTQGQPAARTVYSEGQSGNYRPLNPIVNGEVSLLEGFGGFSTTTSIPQFATNTATEVDLNQPFEAFSLRLRPIGVASSNNPVSFRIRPSPLSGQEVLLYGVDYNGSVSPNDFIRSDNEPLLRGVFSSSLQAVDDFALTVSNTPVSIDVLANDIGTNLSILQAIGGSSGIITVDSVLQRINYTPAVNFTGVDSFLYMIIDGQGNQSTAGVTVQVNAAVGAIQINPRSLVTIGNDLKAQSDQFYVDNTALVSRFDLLANDLIDLAKAGITTKITLESVGALNPPSAGRIVLDDHGTPTDSTDDAVLFIPNPAFSGIATFSYHIGDTSGRTSAADGQVRIAVTPATSLNELVGCGPSTNTGFSDDTFGDLEVRGNIVIAGDQMSNTILSGTADDRVLRVVPEGRLRLMRTTVTSGTAPAGQAGGGILSAGQLSLSQVSVSGNSVQGSTSSAKGGGIAVVGGHASVAETSISNNVAYGGGGVFVCNAATVTLDQSLVDNNTADFRVAGPVRLDPLRGQFLKSGLGAGVEIQGNIAYVGTANELIAVNVSDPASPMVVGSLLGGPALPGILSIPSSLELLNQYAIVTYLTGDILTIDISDPSHLSLVNLLPLESRPTSILDTHIIGSFLYAASEIDGIYIYDISNPITPILIDRYKPQDPTFRPFRLSGFGNSLIVTSGSEAFLLDVSDPNNVRNVSKQSGFNFAYSIDTTQDYVFISDDGRGVSIYRTTDLSLVAQYSTTDIINDVDVQSDRLYVTLARGAVRVLDISDVTAIRNLGDVGSLLSASVSTVVGDTVYVVNSAGLSLLSSEDPNTIGDTGGGGILSSRGGNITITNTTFSGNRVFVVRDTPDKTPTAKLNAGSAIRNVQPSEIPELQAGKIAGEGLNQVIVFESPSRLLDVDTNNVTDVYLFRTATNTLTLVSGRLSFDPATGKQTVIAGDRRSTSPDISDDGRFVVFQSDATMLVPGTQTTLQMSFYMIQFLTP